MISNHGTGGGNNTNWTPNDAQLAQAFGVAIVPAMFSNTNQALNPLTMTPSIPGAITVLALPPLDAAGIVVSGFPLALER